MTEPSERTNDRSVAAGQETQDSSGGQKPTVEPDQSSSWGLRFENWSKRNIVLAVAVFAAILVSSVITLASATTGITHWYRSTFDWRTAEYRKLASLRAGYSIEKFKEELGAPLFKTPIPKSKLTDNVFQGRDYWVQVITDPHDVAMSYAVTSCRLDFQPSFSLPSFSFGEGGSTERRVVLNRSSLSDVLVEPLGTLRINISGATANSYIFRIFYGGNPTNYKSYAWGLNDSCPWSFERSKNLYEAWFDWSFQNPRRRDYDIKDLDSAARELLSKSVVNTYAETAPGIDFEKIYSEQIGVDRILIRTVPGG